MIYLSWLRKNFQQLPPDAKDVVIAQHARAHIMMLIGGCLMPDTSGARFHFMYLLLLSILTKVGHYRWGAALLASLFQALDWVVKSDQTEIGGCLLLLQSWAWDCIKCIDRSSIHGRSTRRTWISSCTKVDLSNYRNKHFHQSSQIDKRHIW